MCGRKSLTKSKKAIIDELLIDEWQVENYSKALDLTIEWYLDNYINYIK